MRRSLSSEGSQSPRSLKRDISFETANEVSMMQGDEWEETHAQLTIEEFVDEHKVVLDSLLIQLIEVRLGDAQESIQELEDESGVCVASNEILLTFEQSALSGSLSFGDTDLVTASTKTLLTLTWKKEVDPRVMMGERTSAFEMTCIRKTSAIERL